ncbi:MAG TPA: DCC1-like thiol-disulfide oxidoreductase family protein [Longimicrobiales bacterium]
MGRLMRRFDAHWFAPAPLGELAAARIVLVGTQLFLLLYGTLVASLRACPACSLDYQLWLTGIDASTYLPRPALKVLLLPLGGWGVRPDPMFLHAVWWTAVVSGIGAFVGMYTRLSLLCFAAANTLLIAHGYAYHELHHTEALLIIMLWVLAFGPSGRALSLDDIRSRIRIGLAGMQFRARTPEDEIDTFARWPLRVGQWLMVLAYLSAALSKLRNGGLDWFNGETLTYYLASDGLAYGRPLGLWLSGFPTLATLLSIATVAFEATFALAVLVPALALPYVLGGVLLHLSIFAVQGPPFLQTTALYIVFIGAVRRRRAAPEPAPEARARRGRWTIVFDGLCPICIRTAVLLDALDLRRRLDFIDLEREWTTAALEAPGLTLEEARHAMHVIDPAGGIHRGFFAFRSLARALPPLWPALPLLYAPLAARIGPKLYDRVARRRRGEACSYATCGV